MLGYMIQQAWCGLAWPVHWVDPEHTESAGGLRWVLLNTGCGERRPSLHAPPTHQNRIVILTFYTTTCGKHGRILTRDITFNIVLDITKRGGTRRVFLPEIYRERGGRLRNLLFRIFIVT